MYPEPIPRTISPRTSLSICCRSSRIRRAIVRFAKRKCAGAPWRRSSSTYMHMSDALVTAIDRYLADLRLQNASPHTLRNYASDLEQFAGYFRPPGQDAPAPAEFTVLQI